MEILDWRWKTLDTMRTTLLLAALVACGTAQAQLNNGGFENWTGQVPFGWSNNNIAPLSLFPVSQSTDAHGGAYAVRGEVLQYNGQPYPPLLQNLAQPVTGAPSALNGWYKFMPMAAGDMVTISISVLDATSQPVGVGVATLMNAQNTYQQFSVPVDYNLGNLNPPATAVISFGMAAAGGTPAVGSAWLVDDLSLGAATGIADLPMASFSLGQPFPQPMTESVQVPLHLVSATCLTAQVLDLSGQVVHTLLDAPMQPGEHLLRWSAEQVADGCYILRITGMGATRQRLVVVQR